MVELQETKSRLWSYEWIQWSKALSLKWMGCHKHVILRVIVGFRVRVYELWINEGTQHDTGAKNWLTRKDPDAGKDWRQEKRTTEDKMVGYITDSMDMNLSKLQELMDREAWQAAVHAVAKRWTWLSDWTEVNWTECDTNDSQKKPVSEWSRLFFDLMCIKLIVLQYLHLATHVLWP